MAQQKDQGYVAIQYIMLPRKEKKTNKYKVFVRLLLKLLEDSLLMV